MIYLVLGVATALIAIIPTGILFRSKNSSPYMGELAITKPTEKVVSDGILFGIAFAYFFVASIRFYVGTDYTTYMEHQIPNVLGYIYDPGHSVEPLYVELIKFGVSLGSYQWIFVLTHLLIIGFIFLYIKRRSINYSISIFILMFGTFYNFSLNGMRQSIATAIFLFSTQYIIRKNPVRYFVCVAVAILFHTSAVIYIPVYLLGKLHLKRLRQTFVILLILSPIVVISFNKLFQFFYWIAIEFGFYSKFFESNFDASVFKRFNLMYLAINLLIFFGIAFLRGNRTGQASVNKLDFEESLNLDINIQLIATLLSVFSFVIPGSFRLIYMFVPIQMSLIPSFISTISNKGIRILVTVSILAVFFWLFCVVILTWNHNGTLPYRTMLQ